MVNWHDQTPFSRMLGIIVFVGALPILFFYLGMQYQQTLETKDLMQVYSFPRLEHYPAFEEELPAETRAASTSREE